MRASIPAIWTGSGWLFEGVLGCILLDWLGTDLDFSCAGAGCKSGTVIAAMMLILRRGEIRVGMGMWVIDFLWEFHGGWCLCRSA